MYEELLSEHEMIKWEGESSKKPASIIPCYGIMKRIFFRGTNRFLLFNEISTAELVDQVLIFGPGSVLTSKDDLCQANEITRLRTCSSFQQTKPLPVPLNGCPCASV